MTIPSETSILRKIGVDARWTDYGGGGMGQALGTTFRAEWQFDVPEPFLRVLMIYDIYEYYEGGNTAHWNTLYLLPDSRIGPEFPMVEKIRSVTVRSFPLFGKATGVRWKAGGRKQNEVFSEGVMGQLSQDRSVEREIVKSNHDFTIELDRDRSCWVIGRDETGTSAQNSSLPRANPTVLENLTRQRWESLKAIARCLLETPIST